MTTVRLGIMRILESNKGRPTEQTGFEDSWKTSIVRASAAIFATAPVCVRPSARERFLSPKNGTGSRRLPNVDQLDDGVADSDLVLVRLRSNRSPKCQRLQFTIGPRSVFMKYLGYAKKLQ